ncbi:MAG: ATP-binding protein [Thermodesulfobacteriota bacterium]
MGIRTKLVIAFAGLLLIVAAVGVVSIHTLNESGQAIARKTVEDTGIGISPEYLPRVFEKFFRVPGQDQISSGLGLTIVKEIVEALGGTIAVASDPGKGTKFTFTVKAAQEPGLK